MRGKPLRQRPRNFRPDPESGVRALGGPTAWMRRLRAIEDAVEQHERRLDEAWRTLAEEVEDPAEFTAAWRELAESWSFADVNDLIERHNRNFPVEARLAMDPRTRDFVRINGRSYLREPLDAEWILEHFPPDRKQAAARFRLVGGSRGAASAPSTGSIHGSRRLIQISASGRSSNGASSSEPSWISTPSSSRRKRREPQRGTEAVVVVGRVLAGRLEGASGHWP